MGRSEAFPQDVEEVAKLAGAVLDFSYIPFALEIFRGPCNSYR
jgi:hypothetical protein